MRNTIEKDEKYILEKIENTFPSISDWGVWEMQRWLRVGAHAAESSLGLVGCLRNVPVWNVDDEKEDDQDDDQPMKCFLNWRIFTLSPFQTEIFTDADAAMQWCN